MKTLTLGYSPCPNDTFIFYGLVHGQIPLGNLRFAEPCLEDVETLNRWALNKKLDVTKISFHGLGHVLDEYCVLPSGAALGRGCGPLLVARPDFSISSLTDAIVAIPGVYTTANMLFRLFSPSVTRLQEMRFDNIMPAIIAGDVDAGVIIHESRFTYADHGLVCLRDLGQWWEELSGHPIPLGCIAARRSLGREILREISASISGSIRYAEQHPDNPLSYIRSHAQEMDGEVMRNHIGLYVNEYSRDLGAAGFEAAEEFLERGRRGGIIPQSRQSVSCLK